MIRKFKYIIPAVLLMSSVSCKKALDINTDPGRPLAAPVSKLLPTAEVSLAASQTISGGIGEVLEVYVHRLATREDPDQYGAAGDNFNIASNWIGVYISTLTNLDAIINQATLDGNTHYAGIAEILKVYAYAQLVDVYGDVPFSEVNKTGITSPKFDKGADIYAQIITLLDKGIADVSAVKTSAAEPAADDLIYGGVNPASAITSGTAKWVRAGKSLKLKLLLQQRLVKNVSADVTALVTENKLISRTEDSFMLPFGPNGATDDRNPGYADYYASQRGEYISSWFYGIMQGNNPSINTSNADPRIPYYFFRQLGTTASATNPTEYRDGGFVTIYFGSQGPNAAQNQQNNMTVLGAYPVGGRYDDGTPRVVNATSGSGAAPYRFITYADVLYMQAELQQVGVLTGSARTTLQAAINESFKQVDYVITNYVKPATFTPAQTVPALVGTAAVTTYVTKAMAEYDAPHVIAGYGAQTTAAKQLEFIMTQKWISSFGSSVDAYNDYRRTGYPTLFDPKNTTMAPGGVAQPPINGDPTKAAQPGVKVTVLKNYPQTLPWYTAEIERNANAPAQKADPSTYKPFWKP